MGDKLQSVIQTLMAQDLGIRLDSWTGYRSVVDYYLAVAMAHCLDFEIQMANSRAGRLAVPLDRDLCRTPWPCKSTVGRYCSVLVFPHRSKSRVLWGCSLRHQGRHLLVPRMPDTQSRM